MCRTIQVHLFQSHIKTKGILQVTRIIIWKIILIILHLITINNPHLILIPLLPIDSIQLQLDNLRGIPQKSLMSIIDIRNILLHSSDLEFLYLRQPIQERIGHLSALVVHLPCCLLLGDLV